MCQVFTPKKKQKTSIEVSSSLASMSSFPELPRAPSSTKITFFETPRAQGTKILSILKNAGTKKKNGVVIQKTKAKQPKKKIGDKVPTLGEDQSNISSFEPMETKNSRKLRLFSPVLFPKKSNKKTHHQTFHNIRHVYQPWCFFKPSTILHPLHLGKKNEQFLHLKSCRPGRFHIFRTSTP